MKYSDEELAEAAVLLAHTEQSEGLTPAVEASLLAEAAKVAAAARHSTTRGAAMELGDGSLARRESLSGTRLRQGSFVPWMGWCAAAAAAALLVYGLRRPASTTSSATAPLQQNPIELKDATGAVLASLDVQSTEAIPLLSVKRLPAAPGERYQLWSSREDGVIRPLGYFGCETACVDVSWRVHDAPRGGQLRRLWITRSATEARVFGVGTQIVASAQ